MAFFEDVSGAEGFAYFTACTMFICLLFPSYAINDWITTFSIVYFPVITMQTWLIVFIQQNWTVENLSQDMSTRVAYLVGIPLGILLLCCVKLPFIRLIVMTSFVTLLAFGVAWLPAQAWIMIPCVVVVGVAVYYIWKCTRSNPNDPPPHIILYDVLVAFVYHVCVSYITVAAIRWLDSDHAHPLLGTSWTQDWYIIWACIMAFRIIETIVILVVVSRKNHIRSIKQLVNVTLDDIGTGNMFDPRYGVPHFLMNLINPDTRFPHGRHRLNAVKPVADSNDANGNTGNSDSGTTDNATNYTIDEDDASLALPSIEHDEDDGVEVHITRQPTQTRGHDRNEEHGRTEEHGHGDHFDENYNKVDDRKYSDNGDDSN